MQVDGPMVTGDPTANRWFTVSVRRRLLVVVHNVTAATRLLDVLPLVTDSRIQVLFTRTGSSAFDAGTTELLTQLEMPVIPWQDALDGQFDLALAASYGETSTTSTRPSSSFHTESDTISI